VSRAGTPSEFQLEFPVAPGRHPSASQAQVAGIVPIKDATIACNKKVDYGCDLKRDLIRRLAEDRHPP